MEGFYTVNTPGDALARARTASVRVLYEAACEYLPALDDDVDEAVALMVAWSGEAPRRAEAMIFALHRLRDLPGVKAVQEELFHLDFTRLIVIDQVLGKLGPDIPPDVLARLDVQITKYLTPRKPRQILPSVANIRRHVNKLIAVEDPAVGEGMEKQKEKPKPPRYDSTSLGGGRELISAEYDSKDAVMIHKAIESCAKDQEISRAEALKRLVLGEVAAPSVQLQVYRATDVKHPPAYVVGFGWVDAATADWLAAHMVSTTDLDAHAVEVSALYETPARIKRVVQGRDGTCRFPNCSRPAHRCQMDHIVDHAAGGPTAAFNLASLCQLHHNMKTDGRVSYILDPATDDIVWLFDNGTWHRSEATGPLAVKNRNWVRTVGETMTRTRTRAYEDIIATGTLISDEAGATVEEHMQEKPAQDDDRDKIPF